MYHINPLKVDKKVLDERPTLVISRTPIARTSEVLITIKAPSFIVPGRKIKTGKEKLNRLKEGPDNKEIKVRATTGLNKTESCSQTEQKEP